VTYQHDTQAKQAQHLKSQISRSLEISKSSEAVRSLLTPRPRGIGKTGSRLHDERLECLGVGSVVVPVLSDDDEECSPRSEGVLPFAGPLRSQPSRSPRLTGRTEEFV
jgi:hypothetical protein